MHQPDTTRNIAETLAEVLPKPHVLAALETDAAGLHITHVALPKNTDVRELRVDLEQFLPAPRRTKATARFAEPASFLAYVKRHATQASVVWCNFNPQTFALDFTAVIDEHTKDSAGWRSHQARLEPDFAAEWKAWKGHDRKPMPQVAFAEWIQEHEEDIASADGMPTSLQMHQMATEFALNEERVLKSTVRLQSGGVRLTYIADPDAGTTESMQMFEKFALGIPVFHGGNGWRMTARLKYRQNQGAVSFFYELVRADRVHEAAAKELIEQVRAGLGDVPLLMGACA